MRWTLDGVFGLCSCLVLLVTQQYVWKMTYIEFLLEQLYEKSREALKTKESGIVHLQAPTMLFPK